MVQRYDLGLMVQKSVELQLYFNATGFYQINGDLENLTDVRNYTLTIYEMALASVEDKPPKQSDANDKDNDWVFIEAGPKRTEVATLKHELAFLIDDRPEGEQYPLSDLRKEELNRSVKLFTESLEDREGALRAMTFSRRLSPVYKLHGIEAAMSDLRLATELYLNDPDGLDGQRLDILDRDIQNFIEAKGANDLHRSELNAMLTRVSEARACLK